MSSGFGGEAISHDGLQWAHQVAPFAISNRLNMGMFVGEERGRDCGTLAEIYISIGHICPDQRFAVCPR
jgi:hypothetical protein